MAEALFGNQRTFYSEKKEDSSFSKEDEKAAKGFIYYLRKLEDILFDERAKINIFTSSNNRGIESRFDLNDGEYDIYLPGLADKIGSVSFLYPKEKIESLRKKIIFVACHKVRHRIQAEKREKEIIKPDTETGDIFLDSLIKSIKIKENSSCLGLEDEKKAQKLEFDAMIATHHALLKLSGVNINKLNEINWFNISFDLSI